MIPALGTMVEDDIRLVLLDYRKNVGTTVFRTDQARTPAGLLNYHVSPAASFS